MLQLFLLRNLQKEEIQVKAECLDKSLFTEFIFLRISFLRRFFPRLERGWKKKQTSSAFHVMELKFNRHFIFAQHRRKETNRRQKKNIHKIRYRMIYHFAWICRSFSLSPSPRFKTFTNLLPVFFCEFLIDFFSAFETILFFAFKSISLESYF